MNVKRIFALVLSLILLAAMLAVPASAAMPEEDAVAPCAVSCPDCGMPMVETTKIYTAWSTDTSKGVSGLTTCSHGKSGKDLNQKRTVTNGWRCDSCGYSTSTIVTETRVICQGY